ncbi:MAG: hypothetical protein U0228_09315 [Myxococcaceae bacterium]
MSLRHGWLVVVAGVLWTGCQCAQLPQNALFKCEANATCRDGFVCQADGFCHESTSADAGRDAGVDAGVDAGEVDAGMDDAGVDAGLDDAGVDAGMDDAGVDAGMTDAGSDAGVDAGMDDAGFDAGCVPTGAIDEPDPAHLDVDCDGFDGDLTRAVFVAPSGADTNAGTQASPMQTLSGALGTGKPQIYLASGTYAAAALTTAVQIYGGYTGSGAWPRQGSKAVITGSLTAQPVDGGRLVLEQLDVRGDDGAGSGSAAVALRLINVPSGSRLEDLVLLAGTGANGSNGAAGAPVANGVVGGPGTAGGSGGLAGAGGAGASCGDAGVTAVGFTGGSGGTMSNLGGADGGGPAGGTGGAGMVCTVGVCSGNDGANGSNGADGLMSNARPPEPTSALGSIIANTWRGPTLGSWSPAQPGGPGNGGGGGGAVDDQVATVFVRGGGAGGGGSGGCGGRSGDAGGPGGASIGLVLIDSSPTLLRVAITTTAGGVGGTGGAAGAGGTGGPAGTGAAGETSVASTGGAGANGGAGGHGGPGRQGPGGWGGPVVGIFCAGTSAPSIDNTTTWAAGTPGTGGAGDPAGRVGAQPASGLSTGCP